MTVDLQFSNAQLKTCVHVGSLAEHEQLLGLVLEKIPWPKVWRYISQSLI